MTRVLVADDDAAFLALVQRMLEDHGYDVVAATNPAEALGAFERHHFDVAIVDYRLRDSKPGDRSGLEVARKCDPRVPKIIISDKAERSEIMDAVRMSSEGLAVAVKFLAKDDIDPETATLYEAVHEALDVRKVWTRQARESIGPELQRDFRRVARTASLESILHVVANFAFVFVMVWAAIRLHEGVLPMLFLIIGIIAGEITNLLLAKGKEGSLLARADRYHSELLQTHRFEQLLAACDSLGTQAESSAAKSELIRTACVKWMGVHDDGAHMRAARHSPPLLVVGRDTAATGEEPPEKCGQTFGR